MTSRATIAADLRALGVPQGKPLMVHSSIRALGRIEGGLSGLVQVLREAIRGGTLLVPALSYELINWDDPVFSAVATPTCIGAFPEFFRTLPGVRRSLHITHSVCALGDEAELFTTDHHRDLTPGGDRSPFRKLITSGGSILMLGCSLRPNTTMHAIEEWPLPPYLFREGVFTYRTIDASGVSHDARTKRHGFTGYVQRYDRVESLFDDRPGLTSGPVGLAMAYLIDAAALAERSVMAMKKDPFHFVDREDSARDT